MKKIITFLVTSFFALNSWCQVISVPEPEFLHGYYHLTSDSTFRKMNKESGTFRKHESKFSKLAKIGGVAADVAGAAGGVVLGTAGSAGTAIGGLRTMTTASSIGNAAGSLGSLAGFEGMDIVFEGKSSPFVVEEGKTVRIIYKNGDNELDPLEIMRVVRFKNGKKNRRIRWINLSSELLGSEEASSNGFLPFEGSKYGEKSYLITIPGEFLEKGEYGIIVGAACASTVIPVATFSVQ